MKEFFDGFYLTDDKEEILRRLDEVEGLLKQTYWAQTRRRDIIEKSIRHSVCYAIVDEDRDVMTAFARAITDYATLYCLEDVIVDQAYRNRGLGKKLIESMTEREEKLSGQFGVALTKDAQGLYAKYGFREYYDTCMYRVTENQRQGEHMTFAEAMAKEGKQTEAFSVPEAENVIELNGIKSELVISTDKGL